MKAGKRYYKRYSRRLHTRRGGPAVTLSMKLPPFTKLAADAEDPAQNVIAFYPHPNGQTLEEWQVKRRERHLKHKNSLGIRAVQSPNGSMSLEGKKGGSR